MLLCLVSKGLAPINKKKMKNLLINETFSNNKEFPPEMKQEHPYYNLKPNPSFSEIDKRNFYLYTL